VAFDSELKLWFHVNVSDYISSMIKKNSEFCLSCEFLINLLHFFILIKRGEKGIVHYVSF